MVENKSLKQLLQVKWHIVLSVFLPVNVGPSLRKVEEGLIW
jgi:hypothetical protein